MATLRAEVLKTAHFDGYFHPFALDALTFHSKTTQFAIYARYECVSIDRMRGPQEEGMSILTNFEFI